MMNHELEMNTNDKLVILLAKEGDESAFRELYENNYNTIYRLAYHYSKSQQDAEDIMQETFIKAFKGIKKFDFNISSNFSAWIYQIGLHALLTILEKEKREKQIRPLLLRTFAVNQKLRICRLKKLPLPIRQFFR